MIAYFIVSEPHVGREEVQIRQVEGTEEEIYDMTRKNIYRVVDGRPQMVSNEGFIASQVFWTEEALHSHLDSAYPEAVIE